MITLLISIAVLILGYLLYISLPLFIAGFIITKIDFAIIWRYFAWSNQTLGMIVLWTITVYLAGRKKPVLITLIPALFMASVIVSYILFAPEGLSLPLTVSVIAGGAAAAFLLMWFLIVRKKIDGNIKHTV